MYQVIRSHTIAPSSPPKITADVTMLMSIIPLPMVLATAVPKVNAARKLKIAAQTTAWPGVSTRDETTVAIELAATWKPLMQCNVRATQIETTAGTIARSMCEQDRL